MVRVFVILLGITPLVHATGAFNSPCESQGIAMEESLRRLKSCIDRGAYQSPKPGEESPLCRDEHLSFEDALKKYRKCQIGLPTPKEFNNEKKSTS